MKLRSKGCKEFEVVAERSHCALAFWAGSRKRRRHRDVRSLPEKLFTSWRRFVVVSDSNFVFWSYVPGVVLAIARKRVIRMTWQGRPAHKTCEPKIGGCVAVLWPCSYRRVRGHLSLAVWLLAVFIVCSLVPTHQWPHQLLDNLFVIRSHHNHVSVGVYLTLIISPKPTIHII